LKRGVTAAVTGPNGSNGFCFVYNSLDSTVSGAHGMYIDLSGFTPTGSGLSNPDGGGFMRGCLKRVTSPNKEGMTPLLFFCCQGGSPSVNDIAYMLGLSDSDPYKIVLAKGTIAGGIIGDTEDTKVLVTGSNEYDMSDGYWHHLSLEPIVQQNGDVLIKCRESDLSLHDIHSPSWQTIPGFDAAGYLDDVVQINTGSEPLWGGYAGFAFAINNALNRRGAFDALQAGRAV
jgi:hypothetical protein